MPALSVVSPSRQHRKHAQLQTSHQPRRTLRIAPAKQPREEPEPEFLLAPVSTGHWSNGIAVPQTLYEAQAVRGQRTYSYVWPKYFLDGKGIGVNLACALKGSPGNAMPKEELDALSSLAGCTLYFHVSGVQKVVDWRGDDELEN